MVRISINTLAKSRTSDNNNKKILECANIPLFFNPCLFLHLRSVDNSRWFSVHCLHNRCVPVLVGATFVWFSHLCQFPPVFLPTDSTIPSLWTPFPLLSQSSPLLLPPSPLAAKILNKSLKLRGKKVNQFRPLESRKIGLWALKSGILFIYM